MNSFIFRVCAYHGEPVAMNGNGIHARSGLSIDTIVPSEKVINDPTGTETRDVTLGGRGEESGYDVDTLIEDFQDEYGCKVHYDFDLKEQADGPRVFEFDVFEPSWSNDDEAKEVIDDLIERLTDWTEGYPTGR
jgi:hypothetical protein